MYIIAIGWLYVALMMSVAEATNTTGTVLGAIITFLLYGAGPVALLMYILGTPARRKAIRAREAQEAEMLRASTTDGQAPGGCLLYTSPSPRDRTRSRMPSSA